MTMSVHFSPDLKFVPICRFLKISKEFDQRTPGLSLGTTHEFEHAHSRTQDATKENRIGISMNRE